MRLAVLFCLAGLLDGTFAAALVGDSAALRSGSGVLPRSAELDGFQFLDGLDAGTEAHHYPTEVPIHIPEGATSTSPTTSKSSADTTTTGVSSSTTSTKKVKETESIPTGTAYSVIGTIPPLVTHGTSLIQASTPAPASPTSSAPAAAVNATATSSGGNSEWKVIGVAVIAFSAVAAILLLSVFFDHWWRFVRDLLWRRRQRTTEEELVPDWEKAEWDLKFADRHRYPSFTSLPSVPLVHPLGQQAQSKADVHSPPQAAHVRAGRDVQTHERGPARHLDGTLGGRSPSTRSRFSQVGPQGHAGYAGVGVVGLGLGGVGAGGEGGGRMSVISPRVGGGNRRTPSPQHTPRLEPSQTSTNTRSGGNPFADCHSPLPEDVYGGMAH
ncbi:hypothetical protein C8Q80DRAFT_1115892 [Daedaleopsis nitida]|nr:hypothetical protein C8Q80DRAFT_1115892 [Daedaleopsis nitida]